MPLEKIGDHDLPHVLGEDAGHSEHEQRPAVGEHPAEERGRAAPAAAGELGDQAEQQDDGGQQVGEEYPADSERLAAEGEVKPVDRPRAALLDRRAEEEEEEVERYVEADVQKLEAGEAVGLLAIAEIGEGDAGEGVESHCNAEHPDVGAVAGEEHGAGEGLQEDGDQRDEEQRRRADRHERRGVDALRVALLVGEAEEAGLHAVGEDHERHGREAVEIAHDAILRGGEDIRVKGDETPVEETSDDAREAVDGGLLGEGFYAGHDLVVFITQRLMTQRIMTW